MTFFRRIVCILLCGLLLAAMPVSAAELEGEQAIIRDMIAYYFHYREQAAGVIENQLQTLSSLNPAEGELWQEIMTDWDWINTDMPVCMDMLPDGLAQDDSLCIVVLGYGLNGNGSMKAELIDRLEVALACAKTYPNAYVLCTGGETSHVPGISEAGQMGTWLLKQGLAEDRLILETASLSTTENAKNSLDILWREYPQVTEIAIVSSDYHIRWGSAVFNAMASVGAARQGKAKLELAGNAGCETRSPERDSMLSQAWGISIIADVPFDGAYVPELYLQEETEPAEVLPVPAAEPVSLPVAEETQKKEPVSCVLLGLGAVLAILFIPKKRTDGSD